MTNDARRKTQEDFFSNILPLTLLQGFERGFTVRGSRRPNMNCNTLTPLLWPSRYVSPVLLVLNRRPKWWFSLLHLISIFSGPQLISAPGPFGLVWPSLPHPSPLELELNWPELNSTVFCSILRPYITFKPAHGDMDTPPRLHNFFRYLAIGMYHFRYLWNGLCDRHRAEITVMQFRGHSLPVRQSMRV